MTRPLWDVGLDVGQELYLLDPDPTVWQGILSADHLAWMDVSGLDVLQLAASSAAETPGVVRQAWYGLYAAHQGLAVDAETGAVYLSLFRRAQRLPEWQQLRLSTRLDAVAAAFGAAHFAAELLDRLPPEARDALQQACRAESRARSLTRRMEMVETLGGDSQLAQGLARALQGAKQAADQGAEQLAQWLEAHPAGTEQHLAGALQQARQQAREVEQAARAVGLGWGASRGAPGRETIAGLNRLSQRLWSSKEVRALLASLGWAQRLVAHEQRRNLEGRERLTHFRTQALDPDLLAAEEMSLLLTEDPASALAGSFLARALDGELLHARYSGAEDAGRGPLVFLRDDSGSMHGPQRAAATALQLALMTALRKEGRRFVSIPFSGPGEFIVFDPGAAPDPQALLAHLDLHYGHGTEPYGPLLAAIDLIRTDPACHRGDILCLTDGAFPPPPDDFLAILEQARAQPGLQLVAVVVGQEPGQAGFADRVLLLSDLLAERERLGHALAGLV